MSCDDEGQKVGEKAPQPSSLSVGFWDAFSSGSLWNEPVLAALSCSPIGTEYLLILATDGSFVAEQEREEQRKRRVQVEATQQADFKRPREEEKPKKLLYQHGRLLLRRQAVPCEPALLVDRLVSLVVYSKCRVKGRMTPVVSDIQLLPGRWERPSAPFISHPLYASGTSNGEGSGVQTSEEGGISGTREESSSISFGKRRRGEGECALSETRLSATAPVYSHSRAGPVARAERGVRTALADLHLYSHHWEVVARVSYKSDVRSFANAKGESSLFTVHLIDAQATELRATFFGRAVALWYPRLLVGGVYIFSSGTLQRANRVHNPFSHEVEIKFDASARIEEVADDRSIPLQKFQRVQLAHLANRPPGTIVDVLAFVIEAKAPQTIVSKAKNEELVRRELTLSDSSGAFVSLALFGVQALQLPQSALADTPLVAIKGAKVSEYAGRTCLSSTPRMQISWLPDRPCLPGGAAADVPLSPQRTGSSCIVAEEEVEKEWSWWRAHGAEVASVTFAKSPCTLGVQSLAEVASAANRQEPSTLKSFRVIASVFDIAGGKLVWLACPACKRKVHKELPSASTSGAYKCNQCRRAVKPEPRWMLSLKLIDYSGILSCVALGDQGQTIMQAVNVTAEGITKLEGGGLDTRGRTFADILQQLSFLEFEFELTAKCGAQEESKTADIMVRRAFSVSEREWSRISRNTQFTESFLSFLCKAGPRPL